MKSILVPIDFTEVTDSVLDAAALVAGGTEAEVHLFHVTAEDPADFGFDQPDHVRERVAARHDELQKKLDGFAGRLGEGGLRVRATLGKGDPAHSILEQAGEDESDLIVVAAHGKGALYRVLVGSVSGAVLSGASCPVMVVPPHRPGK